LIFCVRRLSCPRTFCRSFFLLPLPVLPPEVLARLCLLKVPLGAALRDRLLRHVLLLGQDRVQVVTVLVLGVDEFLRVGVGLADEPEKPIGCLANLSRLLQLLNLRESLLKASFEL